MVESVERISGGDTDLHDRLIAQIRDYWNRRIHDLEMTDEPVGSRGFFADLDEYRFDKLRYLPRVVQFDGYPGHTLLEVGCGIGTDLVRFARGGARVTGIDLAERSIELARQNFAHAGLQDAAELEIFNGEAMPFNDETFDVVYAHGVLQYTADPARMVAECYRVVKPDGVVVCMVYNRYSWLNALSKVMHVELEHEDAPGLRLFSIAEYRRLLEPFRDVRIVPERFPVASRLHGGWKGVLYNGVFVRAFNILPRTLVRPLGWHLMAFCRK